MQGDTNGSITPTTVSDDFADNRAEFEAWKDADKESPIESAYNWEAARADSQSLWESIFGRK